MASARFLVRGLVQGVCFRASARDKAHTLGLVGHAKNLADGSVEVVASGTTDALDALETWLRQGPAGARVDAVEREKMPARDHADFRTL